MIRILHLTPLWSDRCHPYLCINEFQKSQKCGKKKRNLHLNVVGLEIITIPPKRKHITDQLSLMLSEKCHVTQKESQLSSHNSGKTVLCWGCSSVVGCVLSMHKASGSIPSTKTVMFMGHIWNSQYFLSLVNKAKNTWRDSLSLNGLNTGKAALEIRISLQ